MVGLVSEIRVPTVVAVGFWIASAMAVLTYTVIAFKETATDLEGAIVGAANPLVATASVLAADQVGGETKPLDRGRFKQSN